MKDRKTDTGSVKTIAERLWERETEERELVEREKRDKKIKKCKGKKKRTQRVKRGETVTGKRGYLSFSSRRGLMVAL